MVFAKERKVNNQELPYPKSVFFIVSNEFCERFSFYGMRAILSLYLRDMLHYTEADSKIIYHTFSGLVYFFPIFGAILSDSWLGKFKTILYVSIVYACGNILLALSAAEPIGLPQKSFSLLALLLVAIGTGGIKPCVSAFGGDQFVLPQQVRQLAAFFSMFYFAINCGSLASMLLTPVLREGVNCFGETTCYPLAFAVPGGLMVLSIIIFAAGRPLYKVRKPEENVILNVIKCIGYGIEQKCKSHDKVDHWLDRAEPKYGKTLVEDIKRTLKVLVLFIPLPVFWALYDQQGSGWTFQATRMDGRIGSFTILPDQMQVVNPLLILVFIPIFTYFVYPAFAKCNFLKTPLQRIVCGGLVTAASFAISAGVAAALEATSPILPTAGTTQLRFYNPHSCDIQVDIGSYASNWKIAAMGYSKRDVKGVNGSEEVSFSLTGCESIVSVAKNSTIRVDDGKAMLYHLLSDRVVSVVDDISKDTSGLPKIRTLANHDVNVELSYYRSGEEILKTSAKDHSLLKIAPGSYKLQKFDKELTFGLGGVYTVLVNLNASVVTDVKSFEITQPNSVHILWLLPQYVVITAAEIMFSITGLEFSYSQAPVHMKSVLTAAWLLTTAVGNIIIVIIESAKVFEKQSYDFLLYTGLMVLDMIVFAFMAMKYKYVHVEHGDESEELEQRSSRQEKNAIENPSFQKDGA